MLHYRAMRFGIAMIFSTSVAMASLPGVGLAQEAGEMCYNISGDRVSRTEDACQCYDDQGEMIYVDETRDECLALPPVQEATNFIGILAPVLAGVGVVAALASGGGGSTPDTN